MHDYADVCPTRLPKETPPDRGIEDVHHIRLKPDAKPIAIAPYRQSPAAQVVVCKEMEALLKAGCIGPSKSPYASPVILVKKPDGSVRVCVDYRLLNQATIQEMFPLPHTWDLVSSLAGSTVFSLLDLRSGYW